MCCIPLCLMCSVSSCACECCLSICGIPWKLVGGRAIYSIIYFLFGVICWVLRVYSNTILDWISVINVCDNEERCSGTLAVYRFSFALAVFHLLLAFLTIRVQDKSEWRNHIQDGFWHMKALFLIGLIVVSFLIPNSFYLVYGWFALIGSAFFLLVQLMYLVDFIHNVAESWIGKWQETNSQGWFALLSTTTLILYIGSLISCIFMFIYFPCTVSNTFISLNIVFSFIVSIISILPAVQEKNTKSGLLQSSFVTAYNTYVLWTSLSSIPDSDCNPFHKNSFSGTTNTVVLVGVFFVLIALTYKTIKTSSKADDSSELSYNYSIFHLGFLLGSFYLAMLMTDWYTVSSQNSHSVAVDTGNPAVYIKIVSSWIAYLLYIWTLVAPLLFPDRDFS